MRTKVVCLSPWPEALVSGFFSRPGDIDLVMVPASAKREQVMNALRDADLVIGDKSHRHVIDADALKLMRSCRLIHQPAVGFDTIDHKAAAAIGIPVANSAGFNSEAVADWTVMAILNLVRHGAYADRLMRTSGWPQSLAAHRELSALRVGIVGFGNAGRRVAKRLAAFSCTVSFTDVVEPKVPTPSFLALNDLLRSSNVVTIHTALNADTRGLMNRERLALMPRGSWLVNAARGPLIVEADLIDALRSEHLAGAALDVFENEPLADDSPLRSMENVFLSPHVAGLSVEGEKRLIDMTAENLRRVMNGESPVNVVNGVIDQTAGRPLASQSG
jgi:D-3-phosphoglycerate dehydrogenase